ncbi:MAG: hypothetical protein JRF36_07255 [Deltaproteobacteria bacterium]|jgi:hypothetical protein|nr:hypothetical protein [Deltaproteobacteria bacterium]MBW2467812.1 hypothetical protein [Deltaproteobacteria bacterium]MBW2516333.1 hypothetical protein [Deltaproteobacteria bacterium]
MAKLTVELIEETLRKEVRKLDKRVQVVAVEPGKKKNFYRVTLSKDGKTDSADLEKEILEKFLAGEGGSKKLRKALGKAVSHLSINYGR